MAKIVRHSWTDSATGATRTRVGLVVEELRDHFTNEDGSKEHGSRVAWLPELSDPVPASQLEELSTNAGSELPPPSTSAE